MKLKVCRPSTGIGDLAFNLAGSPLLALIIFGFVGTPSGAPAASAAETSRGAADGSSEVAEPESWTTTLASDVRYFSWRGTRSSPASASTSEAHGAELYVPYAVQFAGRLPNQDIKVELLARGGWVWARQQSGSLVGEVETSTDTVLSGTFTYLGWQGFQPFVAITTNLPTGRSILPGSQSFARMDPDLVEITNFGEGFNYGATGGITVAIDPTLLVTASAGYTWRDPFNREASLTATDPFDQSVTRLDPGDVFTAALAVNYQAGAWLLSVTGALSIETATIQNGQPLYKPGLRYFGSASVVYNWEQIGQTTFTASATHGNRNEVLFLGASALATEAFNTNANVYRFGLQHFFPLVEQQLYAGPIGSFLMRSENSYEPATLQFVPAKERWTAGALLRYAPTQNVVLNVRVEHVWTDEGEQLAPNGQQYSVLASAFVAGSAVPVVSSQGWQFSLGANVQF